MSQTVITWSFKLSGVLTDADSVVLQDPDNAYGVKRTDTDEVVVAAGTEMTRDSLGTYSYTFTDPAAGVPYNYWVLVTYGSDTYHVEGSAVAERPSVSCGPTLYDIRRRVVDTSGHFDLVVDAANGDYSDNGCNCLINAAQRWLDRRFQYHKSPVWLYKTLAAGSQIITFSNARVVQAVWASVQANYRWRVEPRSLFWIRQQFDSATPLNSGDCVPLFYAPVPIGVAPEQLTADADSYEAAGYLNYDHVVFGTASFPMKGLWFEPAPAEDTTIEILAQWYSPELSSDTDRSYWSVNHPDLLARATRMQIEIDLHRNTAGRKDFEEPILAELKEIYKDMVAEEVAGPPERFVMRG